MTSLIFPGATATASCVVDVFVFLLVMALCDIAMAYLFIYLFICALVFDTYWYILQQGATGEVYSQWPTKTLYTSCVNVPALVLTVDLRFC